MSGEYVVRCARATGPRLHGNRCEINIVEHCNLACRSCSHLSPVLPKYLANPQEIYDSLLMLTPVYHARWLRLLGESRSSTRDCSTSSERGEKLMLRIASAS